MTTGPSSSNLNHQDSPSNGEPAARETSAPALPPEALDLATRLFNAARQGDCALFEQVLGYNAGVKDLKNDKGDTLIMLAAYHGRSALVSLLLSHGADPNILNDRQQSPLAGAIFKGEKEVVEALLSGGADPRVGQPSAREAVRIFGQEAVWGERMDEVARGLDGH